MGIVLETDKFVWIGLKEPDEGLLIEAQRQFGLHGLAVEDAYPAYGDTFFIVLSTAQLQEGKRGIAFGETQFL